MDTVNLCIDIGNTTTKAALYSGGEEMAYIKPFTAELFKELVSTHSPRVLVSKTGSNPELEDLLQDSDYLDHNTSLPIQIDYKTPDTLGRDRIAAAVGAYALQKDVSWLILDLGTCLTIDLLADNTFRGGLISPGVQMRFRAMNEFTAGLPLVNLDYKLREQLREEFKKIFSSKASEEAILIYTTTDPVEAMQLGGEVIVMDEGKILQQGSAKEIYENPITTKVAEITNDPAMNLFKGEIKGKKIKLNSKIELSLPKHFKDLTNGHYTFGIRASGITLAKSGFPFQIELAEISGSETFLHLGQGQVHVVGLLDAVKNFDIGETVSVIFDIEKLYAFGSDGILMSSPYSGTK